jgi:hypothetical protein
MKEKLNDTDIKFINTKIRDGYLSILKTFGPILAGLLLLYFRKGGKISRHMTPSEYDQAFLFFILMSYGILFIFIIRHFNKNILPYRRELKSNEKKIIKFYAKKYADPLSKKFLLFHPLVENRYFSISEEYFKSIQHGEELEIQTGGLTGISLGLKTAKASIVDAEDFYFT